MLLLQSVISRSSYSSKFFIIPCCTYDFDRKVNVPSIFITYSFRCFVHALKLYNIFHTTVVSKAQYTPQSISELLGLRSVNWRENGICCIQRFA